MKRVVIIGGGIAGLSTAWNLREGGPDCFLSEKPWAMELCKRLGIDGKFLNTNDKNKKTFVLSGGSLHILPEGVILMIPTKILPLAYSSLISWPGKFRMALDLFVPKKKDRADESLGDFVRRRLGREALDKIAEPLVAGVHAGDPETMSVRASFPKFVQLEEESGSLIRGMVKKMASMHKARKAAPAPAGDRKRVTMFMTLRDGLSELIDTLTSRLEKTENTVLRKGAPVSSIEKKDGKYTVRLESGENIDA